MLLLPHKLHMPAVVQRDNLYIIGQVLTFMHRKLLLIAWKRQINMNIVMLSKLPLQIQTLPSQACVLLYLSS